MDMFGDKEHKLVHGMVNGQGALEGMRYGHCWVESRNTILDHSNGRKLELPIDVYYAIGRINPKECKYYTPEEAAKLSELKLAAPFADVLASWIAIVTEPEVPPPVIGVSYSYYL